MPLRLIAGLLLFFPWIPIGRGAISCTRDDDCKTAILEGSLCVENTCTNPFHYGGCLKSFLPDWHKIRVCNSDDPPEAAEMGFCRISDLDYMEVRILSLNWESAFFETWILQIILSEILDVPVSVETGFPDLNVNFYDVNSAMDYGKYDVLYSELQLSSQVLDCRLVKTDDITEYRPCAHVVPEVWESHTLENVKKEGTGPFRELGALGEQHWNIPLFTAERDPSLTTFVGLAGDKNRQKLAETFKRPTTWKDYCDQVSEDGCATDDGVAARAPLEFEETKMFSEGLYTGHFRATEQNDCVRHPSNCTGHIADYPCHWSSVTKQQLYHLGIALESNGSNDPNGGYTYSQLTEIWKAANATKSDVMMMWWTPEALYQTFIGTDAQFTPVILPPPTQECNDARIARGSLCSEDFDVTTSNKYGFCDYSAQPLKKFISDGLFEATYGRGIPEALQSPAFAAIDNFRITTLELGQIFKYWFGSGPEPGNFDSRHATCRWVIENFDEIMSFVPKSYPRVIEKHNIPGDPIFATAMSLACFSVIVIVVSMVQVYSRRDTKVIFYAQLEFLICLLTGLLLVSIGAIVSAVPPTNGTCNAIIWLVNIGYAVHLTPLVTRIFAINNLASKGKQMHRVRLTRERLYGVMAVVISLVCVFLLAWTIFDAPEKGFHYALLKQTTKYDETIVDASECCVSESELWHIASLIWQACLLLPGVIIAYVSSRVREDMNDTRKMSLVLYLHLAFLAFRVTVYLELEESKLSDLMAYQSILISSDVIIAVVIYIFPKIVADDEKMEKEILPDLFLNSSILVAEIRGFAAWSSVREPVQVFKLLEELYTKFDSIADKRKVYKVETVRDSYVAATGVPEPQSNHATIIANFAIELLKTMDHVSKKLELMFGPDTGDLTLRVGVHSGPVTGGFLKGKGARFQLFGDTVTTACLIQATGQSNRVHLSATTAQLLIKAGHQKWIQKRKEIVHTEEKGDLETYWLTRGLLELGKFDDCEHLETSSVVFTINSDLNNNEIGGTLDSEKRWITWNVEVLAAVLKQIVAQRATFSTDTPAVFKQFVDVAQRTISTHEASSSCEDSAHETSAMPLDEVAEIIELPEFDKKAARRQIENSRKELDTDVMSQLTQYVTMVAAMYNDNPFHNFAHASYVVMAVSKYMNRIVAASEVDVGFDEDRQRSSTQAALHDHTYGITSDPLTRFACVFSALIHDVDHPGVPNPKLIQENEHLASMYSERSVAEQNSFDLAWNLLKQEQFAKLRATICANDAELRRFRQLVINSVMATDLGDKELKALRNGRWAKAFTEGKSIREESPRVVINRKATIVIEHLIQAADIAHTCQHWNIYRKWNERLFQECYKAYREGRAETNPADGWYEGELGFYDFYIIPLAKKLRDCGVFGPTSDENLDYAMNNRAMWEKEGEKIVAKMLEKVEKEYDLRRENEKDVSPTDNLEGKSSSQSNVFGGEGEGEGKTQE